VAVVCSRLARKQQPDIAATIKQTQPATKLAVDVGWSFTPTLSPITALTITVYAGTTQAAVRSQTALPTVGVPPSGNELAIDSAVFAVNQSVKADITIKRADLSTQTDTTPTITLAAPAGGGGLGGGVPASAVAVPELDTRLADYVPQSAAATRLVARAAGPAAAYRASYLRTRAAGIAQDALEIEREVTGLQQLDLTKTATAQLLAYPAMADAIKQITAITPAGLPFLNLAGSAAPLGAAIRDLAMLEAIVDWLLRTDILDFWHGLFAALIEDVAALSTGFPKTRAYLATIFASSFPSSFDDLYDQVRAMVIGQVEALGAAIRAALAAATGALTTEMRQLYAGIDAPLLAAPPLAGVATPPSADDILDPNPLTDVFAQLDEMVDQELLKVRAEVTAALSMFAPAQDLFVALMVTYVCLPMLAAVGVAIAGGPAAAALLAGAVFLAGEELIHLLAKWLGGPIAEQLDGLRGRVDDARRHLEADVAARIAASTASFVSVTGAASELRLSGLFLRELSQLVPDAFLTETANLLGRKRDELVREAGQLARAAELAQGAEHGTVFDVIRPSYLELTAGRLPEAPQLPGGTGRTRHVAETLLSDLNRLDDERLGLVDGKQMLVTKRISLGTLSAAAGISPSAPTGTPTGSILARLLLGEPVAVRLDEGDLLDGTNPGSYRALISDIRVFAQVLPPVGASTQIPVSISHSGISRTRVRRPGGASNSLGEQTLRLLISPRICAAGYRRAVAGVKKLPTAWGITWRWLLGAALWNELVEAAAAADLPDVEGMRSSWHDLLLSLGFPDYIDADERNAAELDWMQTLWYLNQPYGPLLPAFGNPTNTNPANALIDMWSRALSAKLLERSAELEGPFSQFHKWGRQVRLLEEIEPALRDVGFLTLERLHEPEAIVLQLAPDPAATVSPTQALLFSVPSSGDQDGVPPEQKRPLEDRGLTNTLIVQLPDAVNDKTGLYGGVAPLIKDIVLEIDARVCYDPELEAAVRASRRRAATVAPLLDTFTTGPVAVPGSFPVLDLGTGSRRILQLSLRALRDRTLIAWKEARAALTARGLTGFTTGAGVTPATIDALALLGHDEQLQLLDGQTFTIRFGGALPQDLVSLASVLVIDPGQLGVAPDLTGLKTGVLHALGIVVVPHKTPLESWGAGTITVGSTFAPLLTGLPAPPWPIRGGRMSSAKSDAEGTATPIPLADLFASPTKASITFEFGTYVAGSDPPPNAPPDPIYDIIVTLAYSPPVVRLAPASTALL
jgi:hypothetical protein